jgi:dTDP-glucose 4,6-dehydratase
MPRALVTGGAGFLGSHLCDRLLAEGYDVVAFDSLITGSTDNLSHLLDNRHFRFVLYNVTDYLYLEGDLDVVFHLASPASPVDFPTKPIQILKVNGLGTLNSLGLARAKGAKFLIASTSEVYGDPLIHPQTEEYWGNVNPIGVRGVYDESKRYAEALTMAYRRFHGMDTKIFRIFNTYGPRMRLNDGRVVPNFVGQALRGDPITVYGTGQQTRSFCYVSDLIDGIYRMSISDKAVSGPINIGNPTERTMLEFAQEIKRLTNSPSEIVYEELKTVDDPKQRKPNITKAKEVLGWEPKVSLEDGLRETIAYFQGKLSEWQPA